jgi:hypothetical protein
MAAIVAHGSSRVARALNHVVEQKDAIAKRFKEYKLKERTEAGTRRGLHITAATAGGALHGLIETKMPSFSVGDVEVPTALAVGIGVSALAVTGMAGAQSDYLTSFAAGLMACEASNFVKAQLA